ncbi:L-fucose:H+ symporter permease [Mucilaginibacter sp. BJC16-A38]|uniref:L-fucose:H+ symporter permease n=1 Tax=Mucilaginibacter phenanthrenivorans TaxID=1234842 RepID=UPI0021588FA8|nr:L-fucose:H+ symporter permease [Mucilaginibacter phenanthrenivorans]MCR8556979.1 L-fucose:H+ symporter permease [Mucilaginibacter phenanthrenivorans]
MHNHIEKSAPVRRLKVQHLGLLRAPNGKSYFYPFALVTSLFLLWGFAHGLLDVLDKHFQNTLHISKAESGFVQFSLYIGYLVMAGPAGLFMKKYGYKSGIILGLMLFAGGAFLFYPAAHFGAFIPFLGSLFIIACGLSCLETAANPYTTVLGPPEGAARRINFAQSFNGLGWILGPLIGGLFIFGAAQKTGPEQFDSLTRPYIYIGCIVIVVAVIFAFSKLPDVKEENSEHIDAKAPLSELLKHKGFVLAVIAQFLYVAAQTGVNSFFINDVTETIAGLKDAVGGIMQHLGGFGQIFMPKNPEQAASLILAIGGMGSFWIGRLFGSYILKFVKPNRLLMLYALINTLLMVLVVLQLGWLSVIALFSTYFFMSVMFPTIFALGIKGLGPLTKRASSFLVMAVAGGAFCPPVMGLIADHAGMPAAFFVPLGCFAFIAYYASSRGRSRPL